MPLGTCDPASRGQAWNEAELALFENTVRVIYRYGWDGVSTKETGCVGPLNRVRVINTSQTTTYYAWFYSKKGVARSFQITPGLDQTFNSAQLRNAGFETNEDVDGLTITDSDVSPFLRKLP